MKRMLIVTLISVSLIGCFPKQQYVRHGSNNYAANKDRIQCRQLALQDTAMEGLANNMFSEIHTSRVERECMNSLGYR